MTSITFQQTADTFQVREQLFYEPSGSGPYVFARIRKKNCSTPWVKRKISEWTGVSLKHIRHAGLKDTQSTAVQWLSWPKSFQKRPLEPPPGCSDDIEVLDQTRHENTLATSHVSANRFTLRLNCESLNNPPDWGASFPNFYGGQRFGREHKDVEARIAGLAATHKDRFALSQLQSLLFNFWLSRRLTEQPFQPGGNELWTATNGKRVFEAALDDELLARFRAGDAVPTGPLFGYKNKHTPEELQFLAQYGLEPESFRKWGKAARGARRPIFVRPEVFKAEQVGKEFLLDFSLPSGSYATIYLIYKFLPKRLLDGDLDVDFTRETLLREVE